MLLCRPFAIKGVESQHFELRRVLDCIPLYWIRSNGSHLLPDGCGLEGSDLLLKSLHPVTGVTIGSLTLRLYLALAVIFGLRLDFIIRVVRRMEMNGAVRCRPSFSFLPLYLSLSSFFVHGEQRGRGDA